MTSATTNDLYALLGVERGASAREIRRAYRRLARQYHPDLNSEPGGREQFSRLANAYEVLHDPVRRADYDRARVERAAAAGSRMSPHRPVPAGATSVLRGILELTADEAWQLTREALVLHDAHGHTIVLPAGSGHGDQITVRYGARTVVLSIRTPQKDLTRRD